jgi:hypothetical protein
MYANALDQMLTALEGRVFGRWFRFCVTGYCNQLSTSVIDGSTDEVQHFRDWQRMGDFASELNEAMQPVVDKYAKLMRQDLANELINVAAQELKTIDPTPKQPASVREGGQP